MLRSTPQTLFASLTAVSYYSVALVQCHHLIPILLKSKNIIKYRITIVLHTGPNVVPIDPNVLPIVVHCDWTFRVSANGVHYRTGPISLLLRYSTKMSPRPHSISSVLEQPAGISTLFTGYIMFHYNTLTFGLWVSWCRDHWTSCQTVYGSS